MIILRAQWSPPHRRTGGRIVRRTSRLCLRRHDGECDARYISDYMYCHINSDVNGCAAYPRVNVQLRCSRERRLGRRRLL